MPKPTAKYSFGVLTTVQKLPTNYQKKKKKNCQQKARLILPKKKRKNFKDNTFKTTTSNKLNQFRKRQKKKPRVYKKILTYKDSKIKRHPCIL